MIIADSFDEPRKLSVRDMSTDFLTVLAVSGDEAALKELARRVRDKS